MIALLNGKSLEVKNRFLPERMSLSLSERGSTAVLTLGPECPALQVGNWLKDETNPGRGIIWRVKSIETQYDTNTRTVQLEHVINALKDTVMFGEITAETISGKKGAISCTATQALSYVLNKCKEWTLGSCDYGKVSNAYSFNGDDLYSAIETISSTCEDCWWTYDLTVYPFKLSLKKQSTAVACELRSDRNITTLRRTIDRSRMYTKVYPIGENNLTIGGSNYLVKNTALYGTVEKVITDTSITTAAALKTWAQERLNRHCEPSVTVTISGIDLSRATGEPLDRLTLGVVCRVPLPEFNTTITERIVKLSYTDKIGNPDSVTITLANELLDVAKIINSMQSSSSSGSRRGAKKAKEDHAWIEDTTDHVRIVAEAVAGTDKDGKVDWSRVASLNVDGNGIEQRVTTTENGIVTAQSGVDVHEKNITQFVKAIGKDGKITAASICTSINNGSSSVAINADHVVIKGTKTTLGSMFTTVSGGMSVKKKMWTQGIVADSTVTAPNFQLDLGEEGYASLKGAYHGVEISKSGDTYTLKFYRMDGKSLTTDSVDFSRAVTDIGYKWSQSVAGRLAVTAYPQKYSKDPLLGLVLEGSWSGNTYNGKVKYYEGTDDELTYDVPGLTYSVSRAVTNIGYQWSNTGRLTVTAEPQNYSKNPLLGLKVAGTWSGNTYNGQVRYYEGSDDETTYAIGGTQFSISRAVTSIGYRWNNSGQLTVTAYPQSFSVDPIIGVKASGSWTNRTYNGQIRYYEGTDDSTTYAINGTSFTITPPADTVNTWDISGFTTSTTQAQYKALTLTCKVKVNGTQKSGSVTLPNLTLLKYNSQYCDVKFGSTTVARLQYA